MERCPFVQDKSCEIDLTHIIKLDNIGRLLILLSVDELFFGIQFEFESGLNLNGLKQPKTIGLFTDMILTSPYTEHLDCVCSSSNLSKVLKFVSSLPGFKHESNSTYLILTVHTLEEILKIQLLKPCAVHCLYTAI